MDSATTTTAENTESVGTAAAVMCESSAEHYSEGLHSEGNYAKRLFEEILEARHRRLKEYEDRQWEQVDSQYVHKAKQIVAELSEDDDDDDLGEAGSGQPSSSSHCTQKGAIRSDEEEIRLLKQRKAHKRATAAKAEYQAALHADLLPFLSPWCGSIELEVAAGSTATAGRRHVPPSRTKRKDTARGGPHGRRHHARCHSCRTRAALFRYR